jgi:hypothetical protein
MPKLTESQRQALRGLLAEAAAGPLEKLLQHYIDQAIERERSEGDFRRTPPKRVTSHSAWEEPPDDDEDWSHIEEEYGEAFAAITDALCDYDKVFGPAVEAFLKVMEERLRAAVPHRPRGDLIPVDEVMETLGEEDIPTALTEGFEKHFKVQVK